MKSSHYDITLPKIGIRAAGAAQRQFKMNQDPNFQTLNAMQINQCIVRVDLNSKGHEWALEKIARFFRREFRYDLTQYRAGDPLNSPETTQGFVWRDIASDGRDVAWAGCCFRKRDHGWALQWIWMHPYERHKGHFLKALPYFVKLFGNFDVEGPYSHSMRECIKKHLTWVKL